jgi:hypothetical protein
VLERFDVCALKTEILLLDLLASISGFSGITSDTRTPTGEFGKDEMCTNCFKLESDMEEGKRIMKCARCRQVSDCGPECQQAHWKKAHKKEYPRKKKYF